MATGDELAPVLAGKRAFASVLLPGTDRVIAVRVLTEHEIALARMRAIATLKKHCDDQRWDIAVVADVDPMLLESFQRREVVQAAFFDVDTISSTTSSPRPVWSTARVLAEQVDVTTLARLFELYSEHQDTVSPFRSMDDETVQKAVDELGKEQPGTATAHVFFGGLERSTLVRWCTSMALALRSKT